MLTAPTTVPESAWKSMNQYYGAAPATASAPGSTEAIADQTIPPADRAQYDGYFDKLDIQKRGFIAGAESVAFFKKSNLPEQTLAQIW